MPDSLSTAQVAAMAGVHRDTLLRWLRNRTIAEPRRDRHGWRVFTAQEATAIVDFAQGTGSSALQAAHGAEASLKRLKAIDWDFASAKTNYLTHGLHPYPAKFIPQIPNALIQELSSVGETIADIFCGSGTTLLEALQLKRHAIGIDANPLATLISAAKTTPLSDQDFDELAEHRALCERTLRKIDVRPGQLFQETRPFKSAGWRPSSQISDFWFEAQAVEELAELRHLIEEIRSKAVQTLCFTAFAAIIVPVSKQDSDTRYVRRDKSIQPGDTVRRYLKQLAAARPAVSEMSDLLESRFSCQIVTANILDGPNTPLFDLVVTSPPYPNAYSYHLYHRTRLAWLGHDVDRFKTAELGSHRKFSAKGARRETPESFRRDFEQIFVWLRSRLRSRRYACFVIGESTVAGQRVDNALLIEEAGSSAGFRTAARVERTIAPTRKAFNPRIGKIKTEQVLILQKV